ncbi:MAG: type II toxin-antitoxin system VapC family toxin [Phycisphaeraceae bacterium]|nr:type II toxin-antitoxin system VapC family toxin [Phycisphaeraceae bacterium]
MAVLDTATLVDLTRANKRSALAAEAIRKAGAGGVQPVTTRFNVAELLTGVELARDQQRERRIVDRLLDRTPVLEFDAIAARQFAAVFAHLRRAGTPIGDMDMLIASVAIVNRRAIISPNFNHFARIPGLTVIGY